MTSLCPPLTPIMTALLALLALTACGDGETIVRFDNQGQQDMAGEDLRDLGSTGQDQRMDQPDLPPILEDMGAPVPDMAPIVDLGEPDMGEPVPDMAVEPDMGPPIVVPPSDPVQTFERSSCTTESVKGLSQQLIDEMNCIKPGLMESIGGITHLNLYSAVFPYLQSSAAQRLRQVVVGQGTLTISSALRTVPQQYLLYRWYQLGRCNISLAAKPGNSNHNGGLAIDTPHYNAWRTRFTSQGWRWLGSSDPVHFERTGEDVRSISVLAFQRLWNRNNPQDQIAEDGDYGPQTEARLKSSPSGGFMRGPSCRANALVNAADIGASVEGLHDADGELERVIVIAPIAVQWIEIWSQDQIIEAKRREDGAGPNFDMIRPAWADQPGSFELRAYDDEGRLLDRAVFAPKLPQDPTLALWADGFGRYRLSQQAHIIERLNLLDVEDALGANGRAGLLNARIHGQPAPLLPRLPMLGH